VERRRRARAQFGATPRAVTLMVLRRTVRFALTALPQE